MDHKDGFVLAGKKISLRPEDLKAGGLIPQKQKKTVTVRCMAPGGRLTSERLRKIADVADKYGHGLVHLSVRQSPEILYIPLDKVEALAGELAEAGQFIASCGKRVRVPSACGGCEYNPNGLVDSQKLAHEVNDRFFGEDQYHKFKIGFSGCPIDCIKARAHDLGFTGQVRPKLVEENCTACELCARACGEGALTMVEGLPVRDLDKCLNCGDCIKACPFDAMVPDQSGLAVYAGGKHGKHPHVAYPVAGLVPVDKVSEVIRAVLDWYKANGQRGERLGITIDRVGIDSLRAALKEVVGDCILQQEDIRKPRWAGLFYKGLVETFPEYGKI
ncbi:MAG: 4Fe-4S binding protein [Actinobacteria bacterium]|nr:4Fe-4S binding protein [Actinomycetota bacterium]